MRIFKIICISLFLIPSLSYGRFDYDGFLRFRTLGSNIPTTVVRSADPSTMGAKSISDYYLSNLFTWRGDGRLKINQNVEAHLTLQSSFLLEEFVQKDFWISFLDNVVADHYHYPFLYLKAYPYLKFINNSNLNIKIGRVILPFSDSKIISPNLYERYPYALDGFFLEYGSDFLNMNIWGSVFVPPPVAGNIINITPYKGVGFHLDIYSRSNFLNHINFHAIYLLDEQSFFSDSNGFKEQMTRFGISLNGQFSDLDYKILINGHGEKFNFISKENMFYSELAYNKVNFFDSRFAAIYHKDSKGYNAWLYNHHNTAGFLDMFAWGNLTYYSLNYQASFAKDWNLKLAGFYFQATDDGTIYLGRSGHSLYEYKNVSKPVKANESLGVELNALITTPLFKGTKSQILVGVFIPEESLKDQIAKLDEEMYMQAQWEIIYNF